MTRRRWLTQNLAAALATQFPGPLSTSLLAMNTLTAPPALRPIIRRVVLRTANSARLAGFYQRLLGLIARQDASSPQATALHDPLTGEVLLTLLEDKAAHAAPPEAPGLFHIAFLFAELDGWRVAVRRALALAQGLHGASDHGVSWAVYLEDPDGNGLELAWDKPAGEWPWRGDQIQMVSRALPLRSILLQGDAERRDVGAFGIGHLHLQVSDLRVAPEYLAHLGLRVTQADYAGALFLARGDYHHHLAINTWRTAGARVPRPAKATGLVGWDMVAPAMPAMPATSGGDAGAASATWYDATGALVTLLRPASSSSHL